MSRTYSTTGHPVTSYILTGILLSALSATAVAQQNTTYQYQYDANGNLTAVTDPLGHITRYGIDALNRTTTITDANNGITRYSYNGQDRLTAVTDPRSLTTAYTVDGFGHVTQTASPDTGSTASTYDEAGNITSRTDARGKTTQYRYDALNRLVQTTHADGSTIAWSYDQGANGIGRLTGITDASGQTSHSYDRRGRRIASSHAIGSGTDLRQYSVLQAYGTSGSSTGKRVSLTYPSGNRIDSSYDSNGQLTSLTLTPPGGGAAIPLLTGIGYAPFGPATSWTWGNSTATAVNTHARGTDLDGRTSSYPLGHALMGGTSRTLTHDAASRITAMTHGTASLDQSYGYDSLDRLTAMTATGSSQAYQYDANGNRTQWTVNGASYSNTIGTTSNRLTATSGPAPAASNTYDAAGNLVHDGSIAYGYGDDGRLHSATIGSDPVTYLIDGMGRRVRKSGPTTLVPTRIVDYVYDEAGHLLGEYDAGGKPLQETVYLDDMPVAVIKQVSTGTGTRKTQGTTTVVYYVYADHLNTPRVITRASDNRMVWRWDQADAFGVQQPDENPSGLGMGFP